jgi:spermidine synthase
LSSVQSTTGQIVVGEALSPEGYSPDLNIKEEAHSLRYLRASHSLLGGVWIGEKVATIGKVKPMTDQDGTPLGDSIYSTFVLQEAARLVNSTDHGEERKWENALIIGLGAGISAGGFHRHGIPTTIVEIDPAVYEASRRYFGLHEVDPKKVFLEDARGWVAQKRTVSDAGQLAVKDKYDIVVHDCFSGGGVPQHLFSLEFWQDLKAIVHPAGVVVINFAGKLGSDSSRSILFTLEKSFSQCRAFHDSFEEMTEEKYQTEFINMVFFCTLSTNPITFRSVRPEDFLNSYMRRHLLSSLPLREVDFGYVVGDVDVPGREKYVLTDAQNALGKLQQDEALHHWKLMREVLPDVFWETY